MSPICGLRIQTYQPMGITFIQATIYTNLIFLNHEETRNFQDTKLNHRCQRNKYWGPLGSNTIHHILRFKGFEASAGDILDPGLHQDYSAQVRVWTIEANSFWDRSCFRPSSSARRQVWTPDICAPSLKEESLPAESALTTETQERASLPGLLVENNRITRGTSSNQRQL